MRANLRSLGTALLVTIGSASCIISHGPSLGPPPFMTLVEVSPQHACPGQTLSINYSVANAPGSTLVADEVRVEIVRDADGVRLLDTRAAVTGPFSYVIPGDLRVPSLTIRVSPLSAGTQFPGGTGSAHVHTTDSLLPLDAAGSERSLVDPSTSRIVSRYDTEYRNLFVSEITWDLTMLDVRINRVGVTHSSGALPPLLFLTPVEPSPALSPAVPVPGTWTLETAYASPLGSDPAMIPSVPLLARIACTP